MSILSWGPPRHESWRRASSRAFGRWPSHSDSRVTLCVREYGWQAEALQEYERVHVHAIPVPPCQYARGSRNDAKELLDGEKHVDATGSADACTMMNSFMSDLGMGPGELCKDQRRTAYAKTLESVGVRSAATGQLHGGEELGPSNPRTLLSPGLLALLFNPHAQLKTPEAPFVHSDNLSPLHCVRCCRVQVRKSSRRLKGAQLQHRR
ncbi:hypothetical protein L1887_56412 [Cichorium endivia]|nr:hypothetical protein L1887_56412 [Cichorium endivia]